ncbi:hypothetical protein F5J12DRAFT_892390 [Pisolithus orientalis]|uniref:uncharacterized protein n=1 Tax=Pisolithus orientalis TaxID=936130 RepID=UPI0022255948|nr:uncharacterized protein F5J12DRAFT_892390 [Pisolithus orientalis]KAI6007508.1 hypothetical protein F5J12DRAFT_892390 [Pisolithus orientalis]
MPSTLRPVLPHHLGDSSRTPVNSGLRSDELAETKFSVDRCTPRDKYARTYTFMPKSIPGIDDLVLDSPLNAFCVMGDEFRPNPRPRPSPLEGIWRSGGPGVPADKPSVAPYRCDGNMEENLVDRTDKLSAPQSPISPSFIAIDSALRDAGFDTSCLDALDEQLLRSPTDCFSDICWATAVQDDQDWYHQQEAAELDVDIVDMGVNVDAVEEKRMDTIKKSTRKGCRDVCVPLSPRLLPPQSKPVIRPPPVQTTVPSVPAAPLSSSLSSADSEEMMSLDTVPKKKPLKLAHSAYEAHHIDLVLTSSVPSPVSLSPTANGLMAGKGDRPDVLAASEARILHSNPNESVHYFPVSRDREKKERRDRTTSASRDVNRKKIHPQSRIHTQMPSPPPSPSHSPSSSGSSRSHSQGPGGRKSKKQRPAISNPVPLPPHVANAIVGATNMNMSTTHVHTMPIPIPTFPTSGYYTSPPSAPPLPPPRFAMSDAVDYLHMPGTPKSPGKTLRKISSAYSTLTGRKRVKSTV